MVNMSTNIVDPPVAAASHEVGNVEEKHQSIGRVSTDVDSINGEFPTDEELHTLRRVADTIPWRVYTIAFVELVERFSYYGTTVVCMFPSLYSVYISKPIIGMSTNQHSHELYPTTSAQRFSHRSWV